MDLGIGHTWQHSKSLAKQYIHKTKSSKTKQNKTYQEGTELREMGRKWFFSRMEGWRKRIQGDFFLISSTNQKAG